MATATKKKKAHPIRKRDADGLMLDQRRVLQALASGMEPRSACIREEVSWGRFRGWLDKDQHFREAFDNLCSSSVGTAREMLESLAVKAVGAVSDAMESEQWVKVEYVCSDCGHEGETRVNMASHNTRLKGADMVLKADRLLKDVRETDVNITHQLSAEDRLFLIRAKRGFAVPEHKMEQFRSQGLLTEGEAEAVEGEFREVPEEVP